MNAGQPPLILYFALLIEQIEDNYRAKRTFLPIWQGILASQ
jgi:hypothetical protein